MPSLSNHTSASSTKMLLLGDSGTGKTGSLASLVKDGYNLRILDYDSGLDILPHLLTEKEIKTVQYKTFTDRLTSAAGRVMVKGAAKAWPESVRLLDGWKEGLKDSPDHIDLGSIYTWTSQDVLVIDSLSMLSDAALRYVLVLNGRNGQHPYQSDWGEAMSLVQSFLEMLYSDSVKCNVVVIAHLSPVENEKGETIKLVPTSLGKKLPPKIFRYFNTCVLAKTKTAGAKMKRVLCTQPQVLIDLKVAAVPGTVPAELPLSTGLADLFKALRKS